MDGKFARGTITAVALEFDVCTKTIRNIWARAMANFKNPDIRRLSASPQKLGRSGRPRKWNNDDIREAVKLVPPFQRRTVRDLANVLGIPKSTLHAMTCEKDNPVIIP